MCTLMIPGSFLGPLKRRTVIRTRYEARRPMWCVSATAKKAWLHLEMIRDQSGIAKNVCCFLGSRIWFFCFRCGSATRTRRNFAQTPVLFGISQICLERLNLPSCKVALAQTFGKVSRFFCAVLTEKIEVHTSIQASTTSRVILAMWHLRWGCSFSRRAYICNAMHTCYTSTGRTCLCLVGIGAYCLSLLIDVGWAESLTLSWYNPAGKDPLAR